MHVVVCANSTWTVWHFRRAVVAALLEDGHRVTVLAPRDDSAHALAGLGCRIVGLAMNPKGLNPLDGALLVLRLRRHLKADPPDAILGFTIKSNIFGAIAADGLGIPFVPNVTGLGTAFLSGLLLRTIAKTLYRFAFRHVPAVFFQNPDDRDLFITEGLVRPTQARLLPGSGIDLDHFSAVAMPITDSPTFLMIGRLLRDKGVFEFVEAARILRNVHPNIRFQLLGELAAANRSAISRATLDGWLQEGVVEYLGTVEDVRPVIANADCVVLPSYREGAPRALIEAAAMARPIIATDVPGCRAVLDDGISGLLCKVRDATDLAAVLLRFLDLPREVRACMGQAGRRKMEQEFDQRRVVQAYREVVSAISADSTRQQVAVVGR